MPFIKVNIHFVWSTKNREPFLHSREIRERVWQHIKTNASKKGIFIDTVNGYSEHCHCLVSMCMDQTIKWMMQMIKGESAFWINNHSGIKLPNGDKFEWQNEYYAVSVSQSALEPVRNYINNQEMHHQKRSFEKERDELISKFGFERGND